MDCFFHPSLLSPSCFFVSILTTHALLVFVSPSFLPLSSLPLSSYLPPSFPSSLLPPSFLPPFLPPSFLPPSSLLPPSFLPPSFPSHLARCILQWRFSSSCHLPRSPSPPWTVSGEPSCSPLLGTLQSWRPASRKVHVDAMSLSHSIEGGGIIPISLPPSLLPSLPGLLPSLEKLHSGLLQCRAALVRYVEGQRVRCPWFYLLPLEDILHFTCYGEDHIVVYCDIL